MDEIATRDEARRDARRAAADANVTAAFGMIPEVNGGERAGRERFGSVDVIAAGVDVAFFNPVLVLDPACRVEDVLAGVAWVEAKGLPVAVQIGDLADPAVGPALEGLGLIADPRPTPVMVLDPIPRRAPFGTPTDLEIRIGGAELHGDFHAAIGSAAVFRELLGPQILADRRVLVAVGYETGVPVSGAAAIRSGSTVGIYAVATVEQARRRGYGRAVTWAAIDAGRSAWRGAMAILQSSDMGLPVYASLGFEIVGHYIEYARPEVEPPDG